MSARKVVRLDDYREKKGKSMERAKVVLLVIYFLAMVALGIGSWMAAVEKLEQIPATYPTGGSYEELEP